MPAQAEQIKPQETALQPILQPEISKSRRGRYLAPVLKSQAIALYSSGLSKTEIARRLDVNVNTVHKWLSIGELKFIVEEAKERVKAMVPRAVEVVSTNLAGNELKAATFVLRGTGVVVNEGISVNINMLSAMPSDLAGRYQLPSAQAGSSEKAIEGEVVNVGGSTEAEK